MMPMKFTGMPTYLTRENPDLPILTPQQLAKKYLTKKKVHFAELDDGLWQEITAAMNSGKLVLCMGAGTIDGWIREQLSKN